MSARSQVQGVPVALESLTRFYPIGQGQRVTAINDVTLELEAGTVVAITGPSGSGKSTLLHLVGAMDMPDSGTIRVGSIDVVGLSSSQQASYRRSIGFVFQRFHLLPGLTVLDNVAAPLLPYRTSFDKFAHARTLIERTGLAGREDSLPSRLSGGQQQRVAIARSLINNPALLLADEPTGNLDSATGAEVMELVLDLRRERGMTVIVATHDPVIASRCDRIVRLVDGSISDDIQVTPPANTDEVLGRISRLSPDG
jgi:putative ABC transport system ATP-binding protein